MGGPEKAWGPSRRGQAGARPKPRRIQVILLHSSAQVLLFVFIIFTTFDFRHIKDEKNYLREFKICANGLLCHEANDRFRIVRRLAGTAKKARQERCKNDTTAPVEKPTLRTSNTNKNKSKCKDQAGFATNVNIDSATHLSPSLHLLPRFLIPAQRGPPRRHFRFGCGPNTAPLLPLFTAVSCFLLRGLLHSFFFFLHSNVLELQQSVLLLLLLLLSLFILQVSFFEFF